MSPIWSSLVTAAGGLLAGLALAAPLLWHQHHTLVRARHDAGHDDTTGLPNRRALRTALTRALTHGTPCGLVLLDLDGFKAINDTVGHEVGNDLLTEVGRRLARLPRPVGLAARLAGDEFALLVHGDTDTVAATAHRAWRTISDTPITVGQHHIPVHASAGYASARSGLDARDLLHHADQAMYQAKTDNSRVAPYSPAAADRRPGRRYRDRRRR